MLSRTCYFESDKRREEKKKSGTVDSSGDFSSSDVLRCSSHDEGNEQPEGRGWELMERSDKVMRVIALLESQKQS